MQIKYIPPVSENKLHNVASQIAPLAYQATLVQLDMEGPAQQPTYGHNVFVSSDVCDQITLLLSLKYLLSCHPGQNI